VSKSELSAGLPAAFAVPVGAAAPGLPGPVMGSMFFPF